MSALFGDEDVALFVDAHEVGDRFARADGRDARAVAGTEHVNVDMRNEERAGTEDGLEPARDVGFEDDAEDVAIAELTGFCFDGDELAGRGVADEEIVEGEPRGSDGGDGAFARPNRFSGFEIERGELETVTIANGSSDDVGRNERSAFDGARRFRQRLFPA